MILPAEYAWSEPVLIATLVVFVVSWIGNSITFANRFINALVTALVFGVIFGGIVYFGYGQLSMSVSSTPSPTAPAQITKPAQ
jgi:uncharacterized membrane protein YadS